MANLEDMKEVTFVEKNILEQVKVRIEQLDEMNHQVENIKKQISKKKNEILEFKENEEITCNHLFYRIQHLGVVAYTVGYHCCLCGKRINTTEENQDFIGTVIESCLNDPKSNEERFPIPAEYKNKVSRNKRKLNKLISQEEALEERLEQLETNISTTKEELSEIKDIIDVYFRYKEMNWKN